MRRTLVLNVVGLTPDLLGDATPNLSTLTREGGVRPLRVTTLHAGPRLPSMSIDPSQRVPRVAAGDEDGAVVDRGTIPGDDMSAGRDVDRATPARASPWNLRN